MTRGTDTRRPTRPLPLRLMHSELLKIRTTHSWWILMVVALPLTWLGYLFNWMRAELTFELAARAETIPTRADPVLHASYLYTSGQFLVLILVFASGITMAAKEYDHRTLTASFLVTPRRTQVILAKAAAAALLAGCYWLLATLLTVPLTMQFLDSQGMPNYLTHPEVARAILLNLAAYLLWAVIGVGFGLLYRRQAKAAMAGIGLYLAGYGGGFTVFATFGEQAEWEWLHQWQVLVPPVASRLMVTAGELPPGNPPPWVAAAVLTGWAVVAGAAGVLITRRRDIT